ncbi:ROK family transcriptional regulator [Embleya sp. NPDC005971]|uniref:ROK family transcriptional regulator n=1 Tax=Embleya sp. NPDC005971 TaxID=3156724 RepID=UPI0033E0CE43
MGGARAGAGGPRISPRAGNLGRLLECLAPKPLSQTELAVASGLSEATVSNLVKLLVRDRHVVLEHSVRNGRRANVVRLAAHRSSWVLGVDLARSWIRVGLMSSTDEILDARAPIPHPCAYSEALETIGRLTRGLLAVRDPSSIDPVAGVVSVPGPVRRPEDDAAGRDLIPQGWHQTTNWGSVPLAHDIGEVVGVPVHADNDANLSALAELHRGAAVDSRDFLFLSVDAGVGGALVLDGRIYRGATGMAGEFGHTVVEPHGRACWCGARGCLETLIGERALLSALRTAEPAPHTVDDVVRATLAGDGAHRAAVHEAGLAIGTFVAAVSTPLDLDLVVIGGALARAETLLLDGVRAQLAHYLGRFRPYTIEVSTARLGRDGPLYGALLAARERQTDRDPLRIGGPRAEATTSP